MTAETLTGLQAQSDARVASISGGPHALQAIWGEYDVAANVEDGDIFELCYIPAGFLVLGGMFYVGNMDTNAGSETLDMDIGWSASGPASAATFIDHNDKTHTDVGYAAAVAGFVNSGVLSGDAITNLLAAGTNIRPFPMTTGPLYFDKKTKVQAEAHAAAATFTAAKLWCVIWGVFIKG
jgi:hypothetical protein